MTTVLEPATGLGAFRAPRADLDRAIREPVIARLSDLGCIRVTGADAVAFLQSQLTNDVAGLGADALQLTGYCTPKGRLLATFQQWRDGDDILLQLPGEILAPVLKRLSMFVLRAKAKLTDATAEFENWALLGPGCDDALRSADIAVPPSAWSATRRDGLLAARLLPAGIDRTLLIARPGALPPALARLPQVAAGVWWWSEAAAAVPTVFAATQEKFVPQMLNLEVLGGVNFRKGCYPGQEVVARSQYLGKLRRRMQVAHADTADPPAAGGDVYHSADAQPVGTIVMSAAAPGGGVIVLVEVPMERLDAGSLHLGSSGGPRLDVRELPYVLFDPTA
jgi:tRNA-modifying protein YgfZ